MYNAMDSQKLLSKINAQDRTKCTEELNHAMDSWTRQIEEIELTRVLIENPVIQKLISKFEGEIKMMDVRLLNDATLSTGNPTEEYHARLNLLDRKVMYRDFLSTFAVDRRMDAIAKTINENL